jgi:hypothetical protein
MSRLGRRWPGLAVVAAAACCATPLAAQETAEAMLPLWRAANEACASGAEGAVETRAACARRDHFTNRLTRLGLCYGPDGEDVAAQDWRACGPGSRRIGR